MTLNSSDEAEEEEMLKRAIAISLEQEEQEEDGPSSIKGEQKIKQQKRWIVTNVHKLSTFQLTQRRRCPLIGMMRRRMVRPRWGGRAQLRQTR